MGLLVLYGNNAPVCWGLWRIFYTKM